MKSPFDLNEQGAYQQWRDWKEANYPLDAADLLVPVKNPYALTADEKHRLLGNCYKTNMAFYRCEPTEHKIANKDLPRKLSEQCGLSRLDTNLCADEDDITSLQVADKGSHQEGYIPYTNRPISWHTDGYYNHAGERIRAMVLHCVSAAASGGENELMDHEMAYICLREKNPDYIVALMQADVMTIPANVENGVMIRPSVSGPVFSVEPESGSLHMRYTARTRSIEWKQDRLTQEAVQYLGGLFSGDSPYILRHRLEAGQGVICNNVLHNRKRFDDDEAGGKQRLIYRARYYDRIQEPEDAGLNRQ